MKTIYLFGNWKMNLSLKDITSFSERSKQLFSDVPTLQEQTVCALFPPFTMLAAATEAFSPLNIATGAQNANEHEAGAYTGEVSAAMVRETGAQYVILGHSERRHIYGESSERINLKALRCLQAGVIPVLCVGETLQERQSGKTLDVIRDQLEKGIRNFPDDAHFIVAYEPVWAIGTGLAASPEDAREVCAFIKQIVSVPVLYGGSVKPSNAAQIFSQDAIDGGLIGGASLEPSEFFAILQKFRSAETRTA